MVENNPPLIHAKARSNSSLLYDGSMNNDE